MHVSEYIFKDRVNVSKKDLLIRFIMVSYASTTNPLMRLSTALTSIFALLLHNCTLYADPFF